MAYKCRICGVNDVANQGDVCELCSIGQDPYASAIGNNHSGIFSSGNSADIQANNMNSSSFSSGKGKSRKILLGGGAEVANVDPYGNSIEPVEEDNTVQVYQAGQVPSYQNQSSTVAFNSNSNNSGNGASVSSVPITSGITKNISVDTQKKSAFNKLFRTLFQGIPYTLDDDITMFQVFPDYSGTSLNAMGNACDQVIVYGKLKAGVVSENNDIEVYGHRDSRNNIIAKKIVNKASGTTAAPERVIPVGAVWVLAIIIFAAVAFFLYTCGVGGVLFAAILILIVINIPLILKLILGLFALMFHLSNKG